MPSDVVKSQQIPLFWNNHLNARRIAGKLTLCQNGYTVAHQVLQKCATLACVALRVRLSALQPASSQRRHQDEAHESRGEERPQDHDRRRGLNLMPGLARLQCDRQQWWRGP